MNPATELDRLVSEPERLLPDMLMNPEPKETDPKPVTAPWPGEPPQAPEPGTDDGETKVPVVR